MAEVPSSLQAAIGQAQADYAAANPVPSGTPSTPSAAPDMPTPGNSLTENPAAPLGAGAPAMPVAPNSLNAQPSITGLSSNPGVSGSFNSQLAKNMDKLAAASPNPNAPGAWARAAVGAVGATLANANIGEIPKGGGAINGITQAAANRQKAQQADQANNRLNAVAQSEIQKNQEEALDANHRRYVSEHLAHLTENTTNLKNGQDTLKLLESQPSAPDVLHAGLTWPQAQTLIAQNKLDMTQNHAYPDGQVQTGVDDHDNPIMTTTYSVLGNLKDVAMNTPEGKDFIKRFNAVHPENKIDENTVIPGARFANIEQSLNDAETATHARDAALLQAGIDKDKLDQKVETVKLGPDWNLALASAGGDPQLATNALLANPRTAALYPHLKEDVTQLYGGETAYNDVVKNMETKRHDIAEEQVSQIKANAAAQKDKPVEIEGDATKKGDEYISSLPVGRQGLIRQIVNGQVNAISPRTLAGKDGQLLMAEAAQADPDLDTTRIAGYGKVYNDFHSGKSKDQIQAINVVVPHLGQLYDAVNAIPSSGVPFVGVSDTALAAEAKSGNKAARALIDAKTQAGQELAAVYARGAVTDQEHEEFKKELDTSSPADLKNSIQSILDLLRSKQEGLQETWDNGAPSPRYKPPIAIIDPKAQGTMDRIYLQQSGIKPEAMPPIQALGSLQKGHNTAFNNGQVWTRTEDGRPIQVTQGQ